MTKFKDVKPDNNGSTFYAAMMRNNAFSYSPGLFTNPPQVFSDSVIVVSDNGADFNTVQFNPNNPKHKKRPLVNQPTQKRMQNVKGAESVDELVKFITKKFSKYLKSFDSLTDKQKEEIYYVRWHYGPNSYKRYEVTENEAREWHAKERTLIESFIIDPDKYLNLT